MNAFLQVVHGRPMKVLVVTLILLMWASPGWSQQWQADAYVLSVGIDKYSPWKVNNLRGCANDALFAARNFGQSNVFNSVKTKVLLDHRAELTDIRNGMGWLERQGQKGDTLVLFLSGHGDDRGGWSFPGHDGLPLWDRDIQAFAGKVLAKGQNLYIFVDACRSGLLVEHLKPEIQRGGKNGWGDLLVLVAAGPKEDSAALDSYSTFAQSLSEAMTGAADFNGDSKITLEEACDYIKHRIPQLNKRFGVPYEHQMRFGHSAGISNDLVLAKVHGLVLKTDELNQNDLLHDVFKQKNFKSYRLPCVKNQELRVDLISGLGTADPKYPGNFPTYLKVRGSNLQRDGGGLGNNTRLVFGNNWNGGADFEVLPKFPGKLGKFVLRVHSANPNRGEVVEGQAWILQSELNESDDRSPRDKNIYRKVYDIPLPPGHTYAIEVSSGPPKGIKKEGKEFIVPHPGSIDPYLVVEDPTGKKLAENDDRKQGVLYSYAEVKPMGGLTRIIVETAQPKEVGEFTIRVTRVETKEFGDVLNKTDAKLLGGKQSYYKTYRMKLAAGDHRVHLSSGSGKLFDADGKRIPGIFDAYLMVRELDAKGGLARELTNDDFDGRNSRLEFNLQRATDVEIIVTTCNEGEEGRYVLSVR